MAKPKTSSKAHHASEDSVTGSTTDSFAGTTNKYLKANLIVDLYQSLWMPSRLDAKQCAKEVLLAAELVSGIDPTDQIEGILAIQMVATHKAAMECLRRAHLSQQTFKARDSSLKHAERLFSTFTRQMEALDKHRGKGQQKVTVEHVHVNEGGQAIVGNVTQSGKTKPARQKKPPALTHAPGEMLETELDMNAGKKEAVKQGDRT